MNENFKNDSEGEAENQRGHVWCWGRQFQLVGKVCGRSEAGRKGETKVFTSYLCLQLGLQQQLHLHCNFRSCQIATPLLAAASTGKAWPCCQPQLDGFQNNVSFQCSFNDKEICGFLLLLISGCLNFPYFHAIQKVFHEPVVALALLENFLKMQSFRLHLKPTEFESAFFKNPR